MITVLEILGIITLSLAIFIMVGFIIQSILHLIARLKGWE